MPVLRPRQTSLAIVLVPVYLIMGYITPSQRGTQWRGESPSEPSLRVWSLKQALFFHLPEFFKKHYSDCFLPLVSIFLYELVVKMALYPFFHLWCLRHTSEKTRILFPSFVEFQYSLFHRICRFMVFPVSFHALWSMEETWLFAVLCPHTVFRFTDAEDDPAVQAFCERPARFRVLMLPFLKILNRLPLQMK